MKMKLFLYKNLYRNIHSNTIHNSQRMYTIQCPSIDEWINKRCYIHTTEYRRDFPGGSDGKASIYNAGDLGSSPGLGRSPGEGNGNPLQYCCLENPLDREAWYATVYGVTKSQTGLSDFTSVHRIQ